MNQMFAVSKHEQWGIRPSLIYMFVPSAVKERLNISFLPGNIAVFMLQVSSFSDRVNSLYCRVGVLRFKREKAQGQIIY